VLIRLTRGLSSLVGLALMLVGLPVGLVYLVGWPLPRRWPSGQQWQAWLDKPVTLSTIVAGAAIIVWLMWAALIVAVFAEVIGLVIRVRVPRLRLAAPLQAVAASLVGTVVIALTGGAARGVPAPSRPSAAAVAIAPASPPETRSPVAAAAGARDAGRQNTPIADRQTSTSAASAHATSAAGAVATTNPPVAVVRGPATIHVGAASYTYVVERDDTLSKISRDWLGDPDRWPEICDLNWHRHWPQAGGTLRDCDLIYPGWDLRLPADARPPTGAAPAPPPPPPSPSPAQPGPGTRQPTPSPSARLPVSPDPDGVIEPPVMTPSAMPSVTAPATGPGAVPKPATAPTPSATRPSATASPSATPTPSDDKAASTPSADENGVHLPGGSFVPWTLAGAIVAAAATVWLQRRRRFIPTDDGEDDDLPELPPPVIELHRQVARNPDLPTAGDLAGRAAAVPALPQLPPGGVGLVGDGAHAAARAALISTLASGGPRDPDRRGEVVIDATTLTTLFGADAAALGPWPRLHVADDLGHALSILDFRLLHRARVLDEHSLTDLDSLRERAPDEEALPPVLLICHAPPPGVRMRARISFGLGDGLDMSALLLGDWPHGSTIAITREGHTRLVEGAPVEAIGERVAVLDAQEAVAILTTLREAHTGEPPNPALRAPATPRKPAPANGAGTSHDRTAPPDRLVDEPPPSPDREPRPKVRLRVLGTPEIQDVTLPGRSLRGKAAELAVYLACHPDGADTETIAEYLVPEVRRRQAKQQIHTNASNLRHVLGRAGGPLPGGYLLKRGATARYRLDPTTVEVDLWQLRDLLTRAQLASSPTHAELLREACDLYTAPLADSCDYEWVEPHREKARQWGTEAHLLLADDLLATDPQAASDLLDKAIGLDRYNEELYRKAMHARHALGDADGIRALLRALAKALSDLDAEPTETTVELAAQLRTSMDKR
jgi:DNA-binding SARP family transcriptional activator/LysM repeat protein